MNKKIAIIGGGNLGTAIAEGLINSGFEQPQNIIITKRNIATLQSLKDKGAQISNDNNEAANFADYIILAIIVHLQFYYSNIKLEQKHIQVYSICLVYIL